VLVTHPRTPLSRDKLMELARGREYEVFDRSIDVQVSRANCGKDPAIRPTSRRCGVRYVFVPDGKPA
jgi:two-component system phosphate regulon response regulator OmpR